MIELITTIALWCGNDDTKQDFTCRKWVLKCVSKGMKQSEYFEDDVTKALLEKFRDWK